MVTTVYSPVPGFSGQVVGACFVDGQAEVDDADTVTLAYLRRHSYGIGGPPSRPWSPPPPAPLQPRSELVPSPSDW